MGEGVEIGDGGKVKDEEEKRRDGEGKREWHVDVLCVHVDNEQHVSMSVPTT